MSKIAIYLLTLYFIFNVWPLSYTTEEEAKQIANSAVNNQSTNTYTISSLSSDFKTWTITLRMTKRKEAAQVKIHRFTGRILKVQFSE
ncbi:hypothetical protein [Paenibacillus swuensis]|uniref:hypothetical protein n=1 Tax=Paenibacillus swuensis TaxID=1178515 RepID=UPI0018D3E862|nr:hypothetical protein [Paenibacillus swuensis]